MNPEIMQFVMNVLPLIVLVIVAYFLIIRPNQKRSKEQAALMRNLKRGDKVATIGGMLGTVKSVDDKTITIIVNNKGTEITFDKNAIRKAPF